MEVSFRKMVSCEACFSKCNARMLRADAERARILVKARQLMLRSFKRFYARTDEGPRSRTQRIRSYRLKSSARSERHQPRNQETHSQASPRVELSAELDRQQPGERVDPYYHIGMFRLQVGLFYRETAEPYRW